MKKTGVCLFTWALFAMLTFSNAVAVEKASLDQIDRIIFDQYSPDAKWGTGSWLVVWTEDGDIKGLRLDVYGVPLDCGIAISEDSIAYNFSPAVAYGNGQWLVVWRYNEYKYGEDYVGIRGQIIADDGSLVGGNIDLMETIYNSIDDIDIAWGTNSWRVVWAQGDSDAHCVRTIVVNADGTTESIQNCSSCSIVGAWAYQPAIARGANAWFVAYPELGGAGYDYLRAKVIPYDGSTWSQKIVDWGNNVNHRYPAIAYGNSEWLVTWTDYRNSTLDIYAQRRDMSGDAIGDSFPVFTGSYEDNYSEVAYNSGRYQVVFATDNSGNSDIIGQRVNSDGTLHGSPFYMGYSSLNQYSPTVAAGHNGTFLNAWSDEDTGLRSITGRINTNQSGGGTNFVISDTDQNSCDDGLFCTGTEECQGGECVHSGDPCASDETCDEVNDMCVPEITCGSNAQDKKKAIATYSMMLMFMFGSVIIAKKAGRRK